jgi:hypothetical protein
MPAFAQSPLQLSRSDPSFSGRAFNENLNLRIKELKGG